MKDILSFLSLAVIISLLSSCGHGIKTVQATPGEELYIVRHEGRQGFVNGNGEWVIEPIYETAYPFVDGFALVSIVKDQFFLIKMDGTQLPLPQGYTASVFSSGLAPVQHNGLTGFINSRGQLVAPAEYTTWWPSKEGIYKVVKQDKYRFLDSTGKELSDVGYEDAGDFSDGLACVAIAGRYGYINKQGATVVPIRCSYAAPFSNGVALVMDSGKDYYSLIDTGGKELVHLSRSIVPGSVFCKGIAWFFTGPEYYGHYGFIDRAGKVIVPAKYDGVEALKDEATHTNTLAWLPIKGGKKGMVDGSIFIEPAFDEVAQFNEGLAKAGIRIKDGLPLKFGFIDTTGKWVVPALYVDAKAFSSGLAAVKVDDKWGYIDKAGKMVVQPKYYEAAPFHGDHAIVNLGRVDAMIDRTGKETIF